MFCKFFVYLGYHFGCFCLILINFVLNVMVSFLLFMLGLVFASFPSSVGSLYIYFFLFCGCYCNVQVLHTVGFTINIFWRSHTSWAEDHNDSAIMDYSRQYEAVLGIELWVSSM